MSYCRFGDDSDVYVIATGGDDLECCGCRRGRKRFQMGATTWRPGNILEEMFSSAYQNRPTPFKHRRHYKEEKRMRKGTKQTQRDWMREHLSVPRNYTAELLAGFEHERVIKPVGYLQNLSTIVHSPSEMIEHLEMHQAMGDQVPEYAFERLRRQVAEKENGISS